MASWMVRPMVGRSGRALRTRRGSEDDHIHLDLSKDVCENINEILSNVCKKQGITEGKRLAYLNAFVKLLSKVKSGASLGYSKEDVFCCLRVVLVHESTQVRASALRAVRHLVTGERDVVTLIRLRFPYLIVRSVDLLLRNETERIQALRLARRILCEAPRLFPPELICCLVCLANGGSEEKDRLFRAALATLAEICVLNPIAFVGCGGVGTLGRNLLDCGAPRVSESLAGCLLHLLDRPETRREAHVCLHALAAPYCDFHYRHSGTGGNSEADKNREDREMRFNCSRLALLSVLRSWPGVLQFCCPTNTSGLRSIIDILYLRQLDVRKAVLDLLYDVLGLHVPPWTDKASVALEAVDPGSHKESYHLGEGFVVAEAKALLPHLARFRPNIVEIHLALLLYTLTKCGLLEALVDVIVTSDIFLSIRATILLGEVLHLVHLLLPQQCSELSPGLPNLIGYATVGVDKLRSDRGLSQSGEELQLWRQQALSAVAILSRIHALKERHPTPSSLFLDQLMQFASPNTGTNDRAARSKLYQIVMKDGDDAMKESGVLSNKDPLFWNWVIIRAVLKNRSEPFKRMEDSSQKTFIRRLVDYFKPSTSNGYGRAAVPVPVDENTQQRHIQTLVGIELMEFLVEADEAESGKLLGELLSDIAKQIQIICSSSSAHDALFSPNQMSTSLCRYYFLFLGRLSHHSRGLRALDRGGVFQVLLDLVASTTHDCYVKLVISSLDYSIDGVARVILKRALTSSSESCSLYATRFMLVLIRSRLPGLHRWASELLVDQLGNPKRSISLAAASILSEACDDPDFLERLVVLRPSLLHLGDPGLLLLVRFLSVPSGFTSLHDANFVANEIQRWTQTYNFKYVRIVEGMVHDALTLHHSGSNGSYGHRVSRTSASMSHPSSGGSGFSGIQGTGSWAGMAGGGWGFHPRGGGGRPLPEIYVPPHLYGQLVQHQKGLDVLVREGNLPQLFQIIRLQQCSMDDEILSLKAALWAVGHVCTCGLGVAIVESEGIVGEIVRCATSCPVYSIRGTSICVLGLVATTRRGSDALSRAGWATIRHHRHEKWPVIEEEFENDDLKSGGYDPSKQLWTSWRDETESYSTGPSSAPEHSPLWWGDRHSVDSSCLVQPSSSHPPISGFTSHMGQSQHPGLIPLHASLSMSSQSSPPHSSSSSLLATSCSHSRMSLSAQGPSHMGRGQEVDRNTKFGQFYIPDDGDTESVGSTGPEDITHEDLIPKNVLTQDDRDVRPKSSTLPSCRPPTASSVTSGIPIRGQRSNHYRSLSESKGPYVTRPSSGTGTDGILNNRGSFRHSAVSQGTAYQDGIPKVMAESGPSNIGAIPIGGGKSRSNSCTDSTTSGVSSCDSTHASRNIVSGGVQTLSPIPSSASLNTLRSSSQQHQPGSRKSSGGRSRAGSIQSDRGSVGGTSLSSWVLSMGSGLRGSMGGLSGEGARGLAMLRLLNRSRRPHPSTPQFFSSRTSPSCADLAIGRDLLDTWVTVPSRRGIALGLSLSHGIQVRPSNSRALKVRSLDRGVRAGLPQELEAPLLRAPSTSLSTASLRSFTMPSTGETDGSCYRGVALPKDLLSVFPVENSIDDLKGESDDGKEVGGLEMLDKFVEELIGDEVGERVASTPFVPIPWWRMGVDREERRRRRHGRRGGSGIYGVSFGELEDLRETGEEDEDELEDAQGIGTELVGGGGRVAGTSIDSSASTSSSSSPSSSLPSSSSSSPSSSVSMGEGWVWRGAGGHRNKRGLRDGGDVSIGLHRQDRCLICCVKLLGQQRRNTRRSRDVSTGSCRNRTDTESSGEKYLVPGEKESPIARRRNFPKSEEVEDEGDGSKSVIRKEILKYIMRMSNPLWWKLARQSLMLLKQKHPQSFQDVCLYSEVSACLGSASYRLISRHFIQELFFDLNFDELYEQSANILHLTDSSGASAPSGATATLSTTSHSVSSPSQVEMGQSAGGSNHQSQAPTNSAAVAQSPVKTSAGGSSSNTSSVSSIQMSPSGFRTMCGLPSLAEEEIQSDSIASSKLTSNMKENLINKTDSLALSQASSNLKNTRTVDPTTNTMTPFTYSASTTVGGKITSKASDMHDKISTTSVSSAAVAASDKIASEVKFGDVKGDMNQSAAKITDDKSGKKSFLENLSGDKSKGDPSVANEICDSKIKVPCGLSTGDEKVKLVTSITNRSCVKSDESQLKLSAVGDVSSKMPLNIKTIDAMDKIQSAAVIVGDSSVVCPVVSSSVAVPGSDAKRLTSSAAGVSSKCKMPVVVNSDGCERGKVPSKGQSVDDKSDKVPFGAEAGGANRKAPLASGNGSDLRGKTISSAVSDQKCKLRLADSSPGDLSSRIPLDCSIDPNRKVALAPNAPADGGSAKSSVASNSIGKVSGEVASVANVPYLSQKFNIAGNSGVVCKPPQVPTSSVLSPLSATCSVATTQSSLVATKTSSLMKPTITLPSAYVSPSYHARHTLTMEMRSSFVSQPARDEQSNLTKRKSLEEKLVNR